MTYPKFNTASHMIPYAVKSESSQTVIIHR